MFYVWPAPIKKDIPKFRNKARNIVKKLVITKTAYNEYFLRSLQLRCKRFPLYFNFILSEKVFKDH